ncbi:MAG: flagellar hook-length control protein FliK [Treponema sp.]|nr:flagellar hook-length control protein FliK [Treponema sp.]
MQALQFLKGLNALPVQKEAVEPLNKKESGVSSFKSMLEDASRKEVPQKTGYKSAESSSEIKNESVPQEEAQASLAKNGKQTEKEFEPQEEIFTTKENELSVQEEFAIDAGEVVLFGQPIEQLASAPLVMDVESTALEDVTATQAVFSPELPSEEVQLAAASVLPNQDGAVPVQKEQPSGKTAAASFAGAVAEAAEIPVESVPVAEAELEGREAALAPAVAMYGQPSEGESAGAEADGSADGRRNPTDKRHEGLSSLESVELEQKTAGRFTVVDNRSVDAKKEVAKAAPVELKAESVRQSGNTLDITFNLNQEQGALLAAEQNMLSTSDQAAAGDASTFQRMLSNQLLTQAPEFVKAGSIILRDNDNGTINLNLKPESLGNVKITLHVSDKGIEGQIVVASKEAFEAFSQNMDNLKQSFRQSGFDAANLSLSLSDGSSAEGQLAQGNAGGQQRSGEDFAASRTFGGWTDREEKLPSQTIAAAYGAGGHQIDVVA